MNRLFCLLVALFAQQSVNGQFEFPPPNESATSTHPADQDSIVMAYITDSLASESSSRPEAYAAAAEHLIFQDTLLPLALSLAEMSLKMEPSQWAYRLSFEAAELQHQYEECRAHADKAVSFIQQHSTLSVSAKEAEINHWRARKAQLREPDLINAAVELDFIPEGIAVDPRNRDIFLSSLTRDKVTRISCRKRVADVIKKGEHEYSVGVGLESLDGRLYALGSIDRSDRSQVLELDADGNLLNQFRMEESEKHFFNDLAIYDGHAYLTDTYGHRVYRLSLHSGTFDIFIEDETIKYPNGITISSDGTKLFVDSYSDGIRIIDIATASVLNLRHPESAGKGIDGLKYHEGSLYGVINGRATPARKHGLYRFVLSEDQMDIVSVSPTFINHPLLDVPTTFDIVGGQVYLLANSQIDNLDQETNTIIDPTRLTPTYILRFAID
ncbi:MAG: hypothetical protein KTR24_08380 [Saprospiraceae bacterium]|nr:hypothetical protein [Saprospiraceae bacterium]